MGIAINKGKKQSAIKAVVYGPEGIGKSTFASKWPKPLYMDLEGSTCRMDVDRIGGIDGWDMAKAAIKDLANDCQGYKTLVIDTADWLDKRVQESIVAREANPKITSIESFGYGKGWVMVGEQWKQFLDLLDQLREKQGMNILLLAHATMRKFEQPDELGAYDRYELKLEKKSAALLKEWPELLLFANYKTLVVEVDGKSKAQGGKRVMFTTHHNCWDAKNRFGLKDELPFEFSSIAHLFAEQVPVANTVVSDGKHIAQPVQPAQQAPAAQPVAAQAAPSAKPASGKPEGMTEQLWNLCVMHGVTSEEVLTVEYKRGVFPRGAQWQAIGADYQNGNMCPAFDKVPGFLSLIDKMRKGV